MAKERVAQAFQIAGKMVECYEAAKGMYGDGLSIKLQPYQKAIRARMERNDTGVLDAALSILKKLEEKELLRPQVLMLMCAAVYVECED